jgi:hypothetical protein
LPMILRAMASSPLVKTPHHVSHPYNC